MGAKAKRKAKIEKQKMKTEEAVSVVEELANTNIPMVIVDSDSVVQMKCVSRSISIVPNRINLGGVYFRNKGLTFHGNKVNQLYGLFFADSLLTDYSGIEDLECMEEI